MRVFVCVGKGCAESGGGGEGGGGEWFYLNKYSRYIHYLKYFTARTTVFSDVKEAFLHFDICFWR